MLHVSIQNTTAKAKNLSRTHRKYYAEPQLEDFYLLVYTHTESTLGSNILAYFICPHMPQLVSEILT